MLGKAAQEADVTVHNHVPMGTSAWVRADAKRLQQIVTRGGDKAGAVGARGQRLLPGAQQLNLQTFELGALLGDLGDGIRRECFR